MIGQVSYAMKMVHAIPSVPCLEPGGGGMIIISRSAKEIAQATMGMPYPSRMALKSERNEGGWFSNGIKAIQARSCWKGGGEGGGHLQVRQVDCRGDDGDALRRNKGDEV